MFGDLIFADGVFANDEAVPFFGWQNQCEFEPGWNDQQKQASGFSRLVRNEMNWVQEDKDDRGKRECL